MFGLKWAICRVFTGGANFHFCSARKYTKYFPLTIGMIGVCSELYSSFIMEDAKAFPCMWHYHVQPETDWEREPFLPHSHLSANPLCSMKSLQSPASKHQEETQKPPWRGVIFTPGLEQALKRTGRGKGPTHSPASQQVRSPTMWYGGDLVGC